MFLKNRITGSIAEFAISQGDNWQELNQNEIDAYELQEAKTLKLSQLKSNKDRAVSNSIYSINIEGSGNCNFYLRTSDLAIIQARINGLSDSASTRSWGRADGKRVELNKAAFQSLFKHISVNDETVYNLYSNLLEEINNITSDGEYFDENNNKITPLKALNNININFN